MQRLQPVQINGQIIPEGYFLNTWFASRFNANKNVLLVVVGATGSGKSWSCLSIADSWYKYRFFNKEFPIENVSFSLVESAKRIKGSTLDKEEFIIIEEAGVIANALDFQNKIVKFFNFILQSARCKNTGFIFNLPSFSLLNKTARTLAHGVFETIGIKGDKAILKPKGLQTNAITGKIYPKYLRQRINGKFIVAKKIKVGKPPERLIIPYEEKKQNFVEKQIDNLIEEAEPKKNEKKEFIHPVWKEIKELYEEGKSQNEMAKILGMTQQTISTHWQNMLRKGYYIPRYTRK